MFSRIVILMVLLVALASYMGAQSPAKLANVEVTAFEAAKGVDFPPDLQAKLMDELVKQLTESKKFGKIVRAGEANPDPSASLLKLSGVVTAVDEGSRAARYMVGFGAGKASIMSHVKFVDAASGAVKFESDVKATMKGGLAGGNTLNVAKNLAKNIVKLAKQKKF
jgi:hypothetical protein